MLNKRQKAEVKKLIAVRQELKYFPIMVGPGGVSSTAFVDQLTKIPQGDTDTTRDGDRLYLKKMYFRCYWQYADTTNFARVIFFQWKPVSTPTANTILNNGPSGNPDCYSQYNHDNRSQYKILYDRTFKLEGNASAATSPITIGSQVMFKGVISRRLSRQLQYQGGTTTGMNQVYYIAVTDSSAINHPLLAGSIKFLFTDG